MTETVHSTLHTAQESTPGQRKTRDQRVRKKQTHCGPRNTAFPLSPPISPVSSHASQKYFTFLLSNARPLRLYHFKSCRLLKSQVTFNWKSNFYSLFRSCFCMCMCVVCLINPKSFPLNRRAASNGIQLCIAVRSERERELSLTLSYCFCCFCVNITVAAEKRAKCFPVEENSL